MPTMWPIEDGRGCAVPSAARSAVVPLTGERPALGDPPFFDAMDASDVDTFSWDWSVIAFPGDRIIAAAITSEPPVMTIGPATIFGLIVQAVLGPATSLVETIDLNCAVTFKSGRVLEWGVELELL